MSSKGFGSTFDLMMRYEDGATDEDETVELFQRLVNTGTAWTLQGSYGRTAAALIEAGIISPRGAP